MPIVIAQNTLWETTAQAILIGLNTQGDIAVTPLETRLRDLYPVFFSTSRRQTWELGELRFFRESSPWLIGAFIQETATSPTRLRYIERAILNLAQVWQQESLRSVAIAPLGERSEWSDIQALIQTYLGKLPLMIELYEPD